MGFRIWKSTMFLLLPPQSEMEEGSAHTHNLQACLGCPWGGGEELLGDGLTLGQAGGTQHGARPVLINDHGGSRVHPGAIDDSLPQLFDIPGSDWLRVSQFGGKYLDRGKKRREKHIVQFWIWIVKATEKTVSKVNSYNANTNEFKLLKASPHQSL